MALKGKPRSFVGISIGQAVVSLVELIDRGSRRVDLATYAWADTPADLRSAMNSSDTTVIAELARFISNMLERAAVASDAAVFSLPATQVFTAAVDLPPVPRDELAAAVLFKAEELVPTSSEEVIITATGPGETRHKVPLDDSDKKRQVILTATPGTETRGGRFLINAIPLTVARWQQQLAEALGLELLALEAQVFPIMRVHPAKGTGCVMYIHLDQREASFYLVEKSTVRVSRTIDVDSGVGYINGLKREMKRLIDRYGEEEGGRWPYRAYLLGAGALDKKWQRAAEAVLSAPVIISNPLAGLSYPAGVEQAISQKGPLLTIAVGLAARQINHQFVV